MSIYNFCFEEVEDSVTKDEFAWIFRFTRGEGTPDGPKTVVIRSIVDQWKDDKDQGRLGPIFG
jgi:hypothetical protein